MGLLITACTSRKRLPVLPTLRASSLPQMSVEPLAREWVGRLVEFPDRVEAVRLYAGRGFAEARRAALALGGEMLIISAGFGGCSFDLPYPPLFAVGDIWFRRSGSRPDDTPGVRSGLVGAAPNAILLRRGCDRRDGSDPGSDPNRAVGLVLGDVRGGFAFRLRGDGEPRSHRTRGLPRGLASQGSAPLRNALR